MPEDRRPAPPPWVSPVAVGVLCAALGFIAGIGTAIAVVRALRPEHEPPIQAVNQPPAVTESPATINRFRRRPVERYVIVKSLEEAGFEDHVGVPRLGGESTMKMPDGSTFTTRSDTGNIYDCVVRVPINGKITDANHRYIFAVAGAIFPDGDPIDDWLEAAIVAAAAGNPSMITTQGWTVEMKPLPMSIELSFIPVVPASAK